MTAHKPVGILLCLLLVTLVGCRRDASQRDAYIRELRMQEDQIFEMQDYMGEYQQLLREERMENERLRQQLKDVELGPSTESTDDRDDEDDAGRSVLENPDFDPEDSGGEQPFLPEITPGEPTIPEIDLGEPVELGEPDELPSPEPSDLSHLPFNEATRLASNRITPERPAAPPTEPAESCVLYAEQLATDPEEDVETNGRGVMAIVEPLTSEGAAGAFKGRVSLMLVDPEASDEDWEIARWNFTAEEVEDAWRDKSRRVLDLPIAVPASAPLDRLLELWVRLQPDGGNRKLLCSTGLTLSAKVTEEKTAANRTVTQWAAADQFETPSEKPKRMPSSRWTASSEPMPTQPRARSTTPEPQVRTASHDEVAPEWSPQRK